MDIIILFVRNNATSAFFLEAERCSQRYTYYDLLHGEIIWCLFNSNLCIWYDLYYFQRVESGVSKSTPTSLRSWNLQMFHVLLEGSLDMTVLSMNRLHQKRKCLKAPIMSLMAAWVDE
jgi:hypothetical protein